MNKELHDLLWSMPANTSYASFPSDLDREDIPWDRVPRLKEAMEVEDELVALQAAMLLTYWGVEEGFDYLESYVCERPPSSVNLLPHRLRSYDDTYKQILDALISFWAVHADSENGEAARKRLFRPVTKIIELSNSLPFEISYFFWLVGDAGFTEYLPALKVHLVEILKQPELHHWKIADCAHLLIKFDSGFVEQSLSAHGKRLSDYPKT